MNTPAAALMIAQVMSSIAQVLPISSCARFVSPRPRAMEKSDTPPVPKRFANALIIKSTGNVTPTPVSAFADAPGICPMYMRSTML